MKFKNMGNSSTAIEIRIMIALGLLTGSGHEGALWSNANILYLNVGSGYKVYSYVMMR